MRNDDDTGYVVIGEVFYPVLELGQTNLLLGLDKIMFEMPF